MNLIIKGQYFDGKTSTKQKVELVCNDIGQINFEGMNEHNYHVIDIDISPRVGNTMRYIDFPDGSQFETADNDAIDVIVDKFRPDKLHTLIHRLEAAKEMVVASLVVLVIGGWAFIQYGIPYLSREVAMVLPAETSHYLGQGMLESLDKDWLEASNLSLAKQEELKKIFLELSTDLGRPEVRLEFRNSTFFGANAFALPNDVVVFTDQLIEIASQNKEIVAIMLHELGHVEHRHILRSMIQSFSMTFFIMAVSGDVSTASSIIASAPLLFIQAGYSQNMEIEADTYSLDYMQAHQIDPNHFVTIMQKLEASHTSEFQDCMNGDKEKDNDIQGCLIIAMEQKNTSKSEGRSLGSYLSTHPPTDERIHRFRKPTTSRPPQGKSIEE